MTDDDAPGRSDANGRSDATGRSDADGQSDANGWSDDEEASGRYQFETPPRHEAVDEADLRAAYGPVRGYFRYRADQYDDLRAAIDAAGLGVTVDAYLARTGRLAGYAAVIGAVGGALAGVVAGAIRPSRPALLLALVGLVVGFVGGGAGTLLARWWYPRVAARQRARRVDLLLPHSVIFCYALIHGGVDLREAFDRIADETDVYGAVADEFGTVVADVERFDRGLFEALAAARDRTRSEEFASFLDELVGILETGGDVNEFFAGEAERHLSQAEESQEGVLEDLATVAEVYITLVFAGPIFLLVILLVASFVVPGLLLPMRLLVYVVLPLLIVGLWAGLDYLLEPYRQHLGSRGALASSPRAWLEDVFGVDPLTLPVVGILFHDEQDGRDERNGGDERVAEEADHGADRLQSVPGSVDDDRLDAYLSTIRQSRIEHFRHAPIVAIQDHPALTFLVTIPLGALIGLALGVTVGVDRADPISTTTSLFALPFLLAAVPYAYFYERNRRYDRRVRNRFPAALEIVADADANGVPLDDALELVARRTSGVLEAEFDRLSRDVALTDDLPGAFERFAERLGVPAVTRIVRLLDDSFRATNDLEPILRVATDDLETRNRIRGRQRRNMHPYALVVALGVLVYVAIVIVFNTQFLPVATTLSRQPQHGLSRVPLQIGEISAATYRELFFHSALIQAAANGLLLGKLVDNRLASGVKYAAALTAATLVAFLVFV